MVMVAARADGAGPATNVSATRTAVDSAAMDPNFIGGPLFVRSPMGIYPPDATTPSLGSSV